MKITAIEPLTCDSGHRRPRLAVRQGHDRRGHRRLGRGLRLAGVGPGLRRRSGVVGQEVIGQDPRRIDFIGAAPVGRGQAGVPERMKVIAAIETRALRHQGQVAGRAGLRAARRAVPRPDPAVLVAISPRTGRSTRRRWASSRRARWTAGSRSSTTSRRPGSGRSRRTCWCRAWRPACRPRSTARSTATGSMPRSRSSARCATGSGRRWASCSTSARSTATAGSSSSARALEPFDLYWLEAEGFDADALLTARRADADAASATARRSSGARQFRPFFERHVTDVVMVETLNNGLSEARRICDLAAHYDTMVSPHNYMSPLVDARQRAPVRGDAELRDLRDRHGRRPLEVGPHRPEARHPRRRHPSSRIAPAGARTSSRRRSRRHPLGQHQRPEFLSALEA